MRLAVPLEDPPAGRGSSRLPLVVHCGSGRDRCASGCTVAACAVGCVDGSPLRAGAELVYDLLDRGRSFDGHGRVGMQHPRRTRRCRRPRSDAELDDVAARRERPPRATVSSRLRQPAISSESFDLSGRPSPRRHRLRPRRSCRRGSRRDSPVSCAARLRLRRAWHGISTLGRDGPLEEPATRRSKEARDSSPTLDRAPKVEPRSDGAGAKSDVRAGAKSDVRAPCASVSRKAHPRLLLSLRVVPTLKPD